VTTIYPAHFYSIWYMRDGANPHRLKQGLAAFCGVYCSLPLVTLTIPL
jgi:hypothetical protein